MKTRLLPMLSIALIVETGLIHFFTVEHAFEHVVYLGYLFLLNFLAALIAGYGIYRRQAWGWGLGFAVAAGSIACYVWSRTVGLPGMEVEEWLLPTGLLALVVEGMFLLLLVFRPWRSNLPETAPQPVASWVGQYLLPLTMFLMVAAIGAAIQSDRIPSHAEEEHLASFEELASLKPLSTAELEQQYGVRVAQMKVTGLDGLVGVRLEVVDPSKASALLEEHAGLIVDGASLIHAPGLYVHGEFTPGQAYWMLFPNPDKAVSAGSQVSLVFDNARLEAVTAK
jgi:hypothetical protein